jgi:hypothetical protein
MYVSAIDLCNHHKNQDIEVVQEHRDLPCGTPIAVKIALLFKGFLACGSNQFDS